MSSANKLIKKYSKKFHIPDKILAEVYDNSMKSNSPSTPSKKRTKAKKVLETFVKDGCKFQKYPELVRRAQIGMTKPHVIAWCQRQGK